MAAVSVSRGVREVGRPALLFLFFLRLVVGSVEAVASEARRAGNRREREEHRHLWNVRRVVFAAGRINTNSLEAFLQYVM